MREALIRADLLAVIALFGAACAVSDAVIGTSSTTTTTAGGHGGQTGTGGKGGTGGATATAVGDALPIQAVSFFRSDACPPDWAPYEPAAGRFLVPTVGVTDNGMSHGEPLANGEDRAHTHGLDATFDLPATSFAGIAGEANHGVGKAGAAALTTTTASASTGLPYVQFRACKKMEHPKVAATLPPRMQMFFDAPACPDGWKQVEITQGRFVVGLPGGAPSDQVFGGAPLTEAGLPTHAHGGAPELTTTPHGIALASGCCADGYAANGKHTGTAQAKPAEPALPYHALLSCEKL